MRLEYLAYIIEVNHQRSISKAAKKLFITQPSLSIAISNVEEELGFQIFDRSTKGVILTKEGEEFIKHAEIVLKEMENLKHISMNHKDRLKSIELVAVPEVCNSFMIDLVQKIHESGNPFKLVIKESRSNDVINDLVSKNAYIGIACFTALNKERILKKLKEHHLHYETLIEDHMMAFLSRKDILSYERGIETSDLASRTPILFEDNELIAEVEENRTLQISHNHYIFSDKNSIKTAIARNLGYAILPSIMAIDDLYIQTEQIKAIPLVDNDIQLTTILIYDSSKIFKMEKILIEQIQSLATQMQKRIDSFNLTKEEIKSLSPIQIYY